MKFSHLVRLCRLVDELAVYDIGLNLIFSIPFLHLQVTSLLTAHIGMRYNNHILLVALIPSKFPSIQLIKSGKHHT